MTSPNWMGISMDRLSIASYIAIVVISVIVVVMIVTGEQTHSRPRRALDVEVPKVSPEREQAALALYQQGEGLLQEGKIDEALAAFEEAKVQNPGSAQTFLRIALTVREHRPDEVVAIIRNLRKAVELHPDYAKPGSEEHLGKRYKVEVYVDTIANRAFSGDPDLPDDEDFLDDLALLLGLFQAGCT